MNNADQYSRRNNIEMQVNPQPVKSKDLEGTVIKFPI